MADFYQVEPLRRAAEAARDAGDHAAAIAHYGAALDALAAAPDAELAYALHDGRARAASLWGAYALESEDLQHMARLAAAAVNLPRESEVLARQVALECLLGHAAEGRAAAEAQLERVAGQLPLEALCQSALAEANLYLGDLPGARANAERLGELAQALGDRAIELHHLHWRGRTARRSGQLELAQVLASQQRDLARALDDRYQEALSLNNLGLTVTDYAQRLAVFKQAFALFQALNWRERQALAANNLAITYTSLGLYARARAYAEYAVGLCRELGVQADLGYGLETLANILLAVGAQSPAQELYAEGLALAQAMGWRDVVTYYALGLARVALARGEPGTVEQLLAIGATFGDLDARGEQMVTLALLGAAQLAVGDIAGAEAATAQAAALREAGYASSDFPSQHVWWWRYRALQSAQADSSALWQAIQHAHDTLLDGVAGLTDVGLRRSYLNKVALNRNILFAWHREARRREITAAVDPGPAPDVQAQLTRLLATGNRMNEQRDSATLRAFLLDELIELTGAEHALLLLRAPDRNAEADDPGALASAWGVAAGDAEQLRARAAPLLAETARRRQPVLRQNMPGMDEEDPDALLELGQRSAMAVPLVAGTRLIGVLYADMRAIFGRFTSADLDLLALLASQATTALENARLYQESLRANQELERRVAKRTTDLEQRNAELTLINGVQQALASQLDAQIIFDLIGDTIRELFDAQVVSIAIYDPAANLISHPYVVERGVRFQLDPGPLVGFRRHVIETRETLLVNQDWQGLAAEYGNPLALVGEAPKSALFVPLTVGSKAFGLVTLQNLDRELAFTDADVRLLSTLAASLSVALENTRLFEEGRRLLAETGQRAAELAIINSVQEGLAALLDTQAMHELVGDKIRALFNAQVVNISIYDPTANLLHFPYSMERGVRDTIAPIPLIGFRKHVIQTRQAMVINAEMARRAAEYGNPLALAGEVPKAALFVPLAAADQAFGVISVQNLDHEQAFSESDMRLLSTFGASLSVALENGRLFQQARRRADEMAALADLGLNISATLDLPTVLERIAGHALALLHGRDVVLRLLEPDGSLPVVVALGKYAEVYKHWQVRLGYGLTGYIAQSGVAEIVNDPAGDPRVAHVPGTEDDDSTEAIIMAPLVVGAKVIGVLCVWRDKTTAGVFDQADLDFSLGLARQAAIAIENARLFAEIKQQKQFSEALIEASPVAIILEDLDERVTSWNSAAERLFGYTRDEALGQHIDDLVANRPEIRQEADRYTRATHPGDVHGFGRRTRKDGQLVDVEFFGVSVVVDGQDVAGINLYHDITELQKARREAIAANEAKSAFLANMSHELRTPLNAVLGFAQLMERDPALAPRHREHLGIITRSGEHLLSLINDVLEMSKIEAGQVALNLAPFDLRALLRSVEELFRLRAELKQLRLRFDLAPDLPQQVAGDESKLRQILINLLGNAVKFTAAGGVTVRVGWQDERRTTNDERSIAGDDSSLPLGSSSLVVEVEDTGVGIAAELLPNLFQPFVQAAGEAQAHEGTGLGLAITRQFVRLMGGEITVASRPGQGSLFRFGVPLAPTRRAPAPHLAERRAVGVAGGAAAAYRMLVVDDKWENRQLLVEWLRAAGFAVREAGNGQEAVAEWERWEPHLIWMDMRMPVLDGYAATRQIKATLKGQATIVIALTASAFDHERAIVLSAGCDDFVRKPVREATIFEKITQHLGLELLYAEPAAPTEPASSAAALRAALAELPHEWLAGFQQAVQMADMEQVKALARQIHARDRAAAEGIARLADDLRLDQLYALIHT